MMVQHSITTTGTPRVIPMPMNVSTFSVKVSTEADFKVGGSSDLYILHLGEILE